MQKGQGMHGSLSRADTFNNIAAIGPDFKAGYVDSFPMSNADLVPTLASIMHIDLPFFGTLKGRIMKEALRSFNETPGVSSDKKVSGDSGGMSTVLLTQSVGDERYYDQACLVSVQAAASANPCK